MSDMQPAVVAPESRSIGRRIPHLRLPASLSEWGVVGGVLALVGAEASVLLLPPSVLTIVLAAVATALLALDRRLGALGACLLVLIALPFGRAADSDLLRIATLPIRPQDAAIGVGVLLALPPLLVRFSQMATERHGFRVRFNPTAHLPGLIVWVFLGVGLFALAVGVVRGNDIRDVLRDVRWWVLFGVILLALARRTRPETLIRGLLVGSIFFAVLMVLTALLPVFSGAIRARATAYDWGTMRLQFTNDVFLIPALVFSAFEAMRRRSWLYTLWSALFAAAITLSLTRTSMLVALGVVGLMALVVGVERLRARQLRSLVVDWARVGGAVVAGAALGLAILVFLPGSLFPKTVAKTTTPPKTSPSAVSRITFSDDSSSVQSIGAGRFESYHKAAMVIVRAPIAGSGMGQLVHLGTNFGNTTASKPGYSPGVDDAYLTVAVKAGTIGVLAFLGVMLLPFLALKTRLRERPWAWYVPAWLGLMVLTVTQSYATSGYAPFALALLLVIPLVGSRLGQSSESEASAVPVIAGSATEPS